MRKEQSGGLAGFVENLLLFSVLNEGIAGLSSRLQVFPFRSFHVSQSIVSPESPVASAQPTADGYHIKIRIGSAEFEGRGAEHNVRADYQEFLDLLRTVGMSNANVPTTLTAGSAECNSPTKDEDREGIATWNRIYKLRDEKLSLNVLPDTDAATSDAILLIIFGYQVYQGHQDVPSLAVMEAAKQSGLRIDRIDRNLTAEHSRFLLKGGSGKGSRYSLNNRGLNYVQELLDRLFE